MAECLDFIGTTQTERKKRGLSLRNISEIFLKYFASFFFLSSHFNDEMRDLWRKFRHRLVEMIPKFPMSEMLRVLNRGRALMNEVIQVLRIQADVYGVVMVALIAVLSDVYSCSHNQTEGRFIEVLNTCLETLNILK